MASPFKIFQERPGPVLVLAGPWFPELADVLRRHGVSHLRLSPYAGWREKQIDFLSSLLFLERLDLAAVGLRDISPLYQLPNLQWLSLNGVARKIDFTKIPKLNNLRLGWNEKNFSSLLDCANLQSLGLDNYSGSDLWAFAKLTRLSVLALSFSKIESLDGIEHLGLLDRLSLARVNRLESLEHLQHCQALTTLEIDGAAELRDVGAVAGLRNLRSFSLMGCPKVQSVRAVGGLPALETVGLLQTTSIQDGDLSALDALPALRHASFLDRPHYNRKNAQYPKRLRYPRRPKLLFDSAKPSD
jgi:Leucine-rich repeat (LRR) protein